MKYIAILLAFCLASCAPPQGKHYTAPSSAPVRASVERVSSHVESASAHAVKAQTSIDKAIKDNPKIIELQVAKQEVDALTKELLGAKAEIKTLKGVVIPAYDKQVKDQNQTLNTLSDKNAKMQKVYDQVNSHWGLGAISYGVGLLFKHLLITLAVIVVVILLLFVASLLVPALGPVMGIFTGLFSAIGRKIASIFTKKGSTP